MSLNRREAIWLAGAALHALHRPAAAQDDRRPLIGFLVLARQNWALQGVFPTALAELGWVDGDTAKVEVHDAGGLIANMRSVVTALVERRVSVLVAAGGTVTAQAVAVTREVPIVMSASGFDPVEAGWADSYARPGRNVTGLTLANDEAVSKQLELLKTAAPKNAARRVSEERSK